MRRVPAILLLFLFSFSLFGPALFVDGESNLPACCRRDGKHHCGMMSPEMTGMADSPLSGPAVDAPRARCPFSRTAAHCFHTQKLRCRHRLRRPPQRRSASSPQRRRLKQATALPSAAPTPSAAPLLLCFPNGADLRVCVGPPGPAASKSVYVLQEGN